jgi:hypothetical protein
VKKNGGTLMPNLRLFLKNGLLYRQRVRLKNRERKIGNLDTLAVEYPLSLRE